MEENRTRSSAAGEKRRTWGFTLVELIVVISILAVLAGVAYPVYTGYITKANEAADLALLGQVNESFTSALYDVGYNDGLPETASFYLGTETVTIGNNGAIPLSGKVLPALTNSDSFNKAFAKYFEGNESSKFEVYESLLYEPEFGGFSGCYKNTKVLANGQTMEIEDNKDGSHTYTVSDKDGNKYKYTLQDNDVDTFSHSTFGQNMEMSSLMSEVDNVVQALKGVLGGNVETLKSLVGGDDYLETLGVTRDNYPDDDAYMAALSNAVVMNVAEASAGLTADDVINNTQKWQDFGSDNLLAMMAATYGIATGYANSDIGKSSNITYNGETMTVKEYYDKQSQALRELTNPTDAIGIIFGMLSDIDGSEGMDEYRDSGAYAEDLNGYFSAMNALSGNRDALVSQGVLDSGFTDEDLGAILDALFGN